MTRKLAHVLAATVLTTGLVAGATATTTTGTTLAGSGTCCSMR